MKVVKISRLLAFLKDGEGEYRMQRHHIRLNESFEVLIEGRLKTDDFSMYIEGNVPQTKELYYEILEDIKVIKFLDFPKWNQQQIEEI